MSVIAYSHHMSYLLALEKFYEVWVDHGMRRLVRALGLVQAIT